MDGSVPSPGPSSLMHHTVPFVAGWISGAAGIAVGHPLDTVKTLQQVQQVTRQGSQSPKHLLRVVRDIYVENGIRGFFRGLLYPLATSGVINATFFGATELSRRLLQSERYQNEKQLTEDGVVHEQHGAISSSSSHYAIVYAAGVAGGIAQMPFVVPAEVVKVQQQAQLQRGHLPEGIGGSLRHSVMIMRQQGVRGLYQGTAATAVRDVPTYGVYLVTFEYIKDCLDAALGSRNGTVAELVAGGCAGVLSWTLATPADVIKSRVQAAAAAAGGGSGCGADDRGPSKGSASWQAAMGVYREAGLVGFFRGWPAIVARAFVTNAVTFVVYMNLLRWLTSEAAFTAFDDLR